MVDASNKIRLGDDNVTLVETVGTFSANGGGIYALGGDGSSPDIILGGNDGSNSGDDGRIISDPAFAGSDIFLISNDAVVVQLDSDGNGEDADFEIRDKDNNTIFNVDESGNVGVGTTSPTEKLHVIGNALADAHTTPSSRRWKTNIQTIENPLEQVQRLRGVTYDWKESGKHDIGLIAEEVGEVIPEIVAYEENGVDAKSVDYSRLVAVLIEGMKAQQVEITELRQSQNELQKLAARIDELEKRLHRPSLVRN